MYSKTLSVAALALAASSVSAQTFSACNPMKKDGCPSNPAVSSSINCDFTKGACSDFTLLDGTSLKYGDKGAVFSIANEKQAPTIKTGKYIFFGKVEVEMQVAPGTAIVTSSVFQSDTLDEIDWEWLGGKTSEVQTNYFYKGDTTTYDRGQTLAMDNPMGGFHKYTVEWTKDFIKWEIDGKVVRQLNSADVTMDKFPQSPMEIRLGTWCAGGQDTPQGTREWAGGYTDFSKGPYEAYYKSVNIVDYAGGDGPNTKNVKEYVYGDKTGSYQSIKVVLGDGNISSSQGSSSQSTTSKASSTNAASSSKTSQATTISTVTSASSNTTVSTTKAAGSTGPTTAPTTVPGNSAARGTATLAGALLVGAGVVAQLFL